MSNLTNNTTELQAILEKARSLPEAGSSGVISWNDLEDRPFGVGSVEWKEVDSGSYTFNTAPADGKWSFRVQLNNFKLVDGRQYKVRVESVMSKHLSLEQVCTGIIDNASGMIIHALGTTDDPIRLSSILGGTTWNVIFTCADSMVGWCVKIYEAEETISTLDEKYIPDTIARTADIPAVPSTEEIVEEVLEQMPDELLPAYTAEDEGKVLKIVNGVPTWVAIPSAEEASF